MKVVVTGGTGFLGSHLVARLCAEGYEVVFTGRTLREISPKGARFEQVDLLDAAGLKAVMADSSLVFHCAALSSPWGQPQDFLAANVTGTQNVVAACLATKAKRLIHVSTPSIYVNGEDRLGIKESDPLPTKFVNAYAHSKRLAEAVVNEASADLGTISIRPRAIIGKGDTSIVPRLVAALNTGRLPIIGDGNTLSDLTHVDNVVDALLLCANADAAHMGKVYNISNGEPVHLWALIAQLAERLGLPSPERKVPYGLVYAMAAGLETIHKTFMPTREPRLTRYGVMVLAKSMTLDLTAAHTDLGYRPNVSIQAGLEQVLESYG